MSIQRQPCAAYTGDRRLIQKRHVRRRSCSTIPCTENKRVRATRAAKPLGSGRRGDTERWESFISRNRRKVTIRCLRRRLTRSRDTGTAALSFLGTITGKLSPARALKLCRRMRRSSYSQATSAAPAMIKISTRMTGQNRPVASQRDHEAFRASSGAQIRSRRQLDGHAPTHTERDPVG